ncbi:hypothetical protein [Goodfellowiella coeruleoviolacea]|uniref:Uncharacterized protein n=1 Tax=Goodfellowiella coeruleoviolacea TaxID=334858 RepID=A0AAE3KJA2_9PSEU|nr:hypothetical protein [Goodfellowiella coeruleoviolacea]MCP2168214.1 hypothetical protein [Goodfellowiella coeruleoviolacea]
MSPGSAVYLTAYSEARDGAVKSVPWWAEIGESSLARPLLDVAASALNATVDLRAWLGESYGKRDVIIEFCASDDDLYVSIEPEAYLCVVAVPDKIAEEPSPRTVLEWIYVRSLQALDEIGARSKLGNPLYGMSGEVIRPLVPGSGSYLLAKPRLAKRMASLQGEFASTIKSVPDHDSVSTWRIDAESLSAVIPRSVRARAAHVDSLVRIGAKAPTETKRSWGQIRVNGEDLTFNQALRRLKLLERWSIWKLSCEVIDAGRSGPVYWLTLSAIQHEKSS